VAHELLVLVSRGGWCWWWWLWLILMGLYVLHCGGEVLNQLHLGSEELLSSRLGGGGGTGFCWLAICARITGGTSCPPPDLVFTI
jgi:hypothetical protein